MSFLTITIIIAIVFVILTYMDHLIFDFPESLGILALKGLIVDFITIAICIGIRTGWIGFIISAIILVLIFFGIDAHQDSIIKKSHEKWKEENNAENNAKREKLLAYMKVHYPQYKFDGYTAKIFYNNYQYHASVSDPTIWSRVLEGTITVEHNGIEIRFYHPFGVYYGQKDNMQRMQVFFNRHNADCSYKLEFDSGKISIVDFLTVRETPISPSSALENRIFFTAKHLEDIDAELTKAIYDS